MTGLIHLYCGGGKGKTTAAVGLTVRCAGRGNKVVFAQFLKDGTSGECRVLAKLPDVTVMAANPVGKFSFRMTDAEKQAAAVKIPRIEAFFASELYCGLMKNAKVRREFKFSVLVPVAEYDGLEKKITEGTSGGAKIGKGDEVWYGTLNKEVILF